MGIRWPPTLEQAALEEHAAERAAEIARHAETAGCRERAEMLWRLARRCRVQALLCGPRRRRPGSAVARDSVGVAPWHSSIASRS